MCQTGQAFATLNLVGVGLLTNVRQMSYRAHMTQQPAYDTGTVPPETLGWRLQRALSFASVSVEQMSAELGVSRSTVSRWLNDRGTPSLGYLKIWALRTGTPYSWLQHGAEQSRRAASGDWGPPLDVALTPRAARPSSFPAATVGRWPRAGCRSSSLPCSARA